MATDVDVYIKHTQKTNERKNQWQQFMSYFLEFKEYIATYEQTKNKATLLAILGLADKLEAYIQDNASVLDKDMRYGMVTLEDMMKNYVTRRAAH